MKRSFLAALMLVAFYNAATAQKDNMDREAIRKVIDQETRAYFEQKYDLWASTWVQDATSFRMNASPFEVSRVSGWDKIKEGEKERMQNATTYTEENMARYVNKFDYEYYINGDKATVFFKEGNTPAEAYDEMRLMVKQKGEWKINGLAIIVTPNYTLNNSIEKLRAFIGKWKIIDGSTQMEPSDSAFHLFAYTIDIHEARGGIEIISSSSSQYAGNKRVYTETEQFLPDYDINKFRYYDFGRSANGFTTGEAGTAEFDSSGNFVVTVMYDDKATVKLKNIYTMKDDNKFHVQAIFFDKQGKQTSAWSTDFARM